MDTFNPQDLNSVLYPLNLVADHLHEVPDEVLESQLVTYDMLIGLSAVPCRQPASQLLRAAAARCSDDSRRDRLVRASEDVEKGVPCAVTEQNLTWNQAAEASTVTEIEPQKQMAPEQSEFASIPHLSLWDMFLGMTVRIGTTFRDYDGTEHKAGEVLHFLKREYFAKEGGFTLTFAEKDVRLSDLVPENGPMVENEGNAYFEPVADMESLRACWRRIHEQWNWIDKSSVPHAAEIGAELEACSRWLKKKAERGPAPVCVTPRLTPESFPGVGPTTAVSLAFTINFLFAGIRSMR